MRSLSLKLSVLYIFLAILNISFFTIIIFENQIDLITETSKAETNEFAMKIYSQMEELRWELNNRDEPVSENELLRYMQEVCENMLREYIIFDPDPDLQESNNSGGTLYYQSDPSFPLQSQYFIDAQNAITKKEFQGQLYYFTIHAASIAWNRQHNPPFQVGNEGYRQKAGHTLFTGHTHHRLHCHFPHYLWYNAQQDCYCPHKVPGNKER